MITTQDLKRSQDETVNRSNSFRRSNTLMVASDDDDDDIIGNNGDQQRSITSRCCGNG